jgi:hypothetical protein
MAGLDPVRAAGRLDQATDVVADAAADMIAAARVGGSGVTDFRALADRVVQLGRSDPAAAGELSRQINARLSPADQHRFQENLTGALTDSGVARLPAPADGATAAAQRRELALDVTQMTLDIAGLFDPTPVSDGSNALISLFRGDLAGAALSAVSIIPVLGDAAKLGKLGKWAETVANAVDLARVDSTFMRMARPALEQLRSALDSIPASALDALPRQAREAIEGMRTKLDEAFSGFDATVRGNPIRLEGVDTVSVDYVKRDRTSYEALRREFDGGARADFARQIAADPNSRTALRNAGLTDADIARLETGRIPAGWQVHHKLPLDDGGTNAADNLVLIRNDPFHIAITNAQRSAVGDLAVGASRTVDWPVPRGIVYPPSP